MNTRPFNTPRLRCERLPVAHGIRHLLALGDAPLPWAQAMNMLADDAGFREDLTTILAASEYAAYRWETPPVTTARSSRPFEFVLVDSPGLAPHPEPEAFSSHFATAPAGENVLAIPNLGRTATLVVPRPLADPNTYCHLARFVRGAPAAQVHHLWQRVARLVQADLSDRPLWVSTAGGGVSWLHVRIEGVPKYYRYQPYATGA